MLIEEVKNKKRNYSEERDILMNFAKILKPYVSLKNIQSKLEQNGFNGVYILGSDIFHTIDEKKNTAGIYIPEEKIIIIDKESYSKDKSIGIHEMGHAFLNGENSKEIIIDHNSVLYGNGLEEGAMAIIQDSTNLKNIDECNNNIYPLHTTIFHQLNTLYKYSNVRKYENLLIHLFNEPKSFIPLIKDIYEDIFMSRFSKSDNELAIRSAFLMMSGTDALVEYSDIELYTFLNYVNSIYLKLLDDKVKTEEKNNKFFINSNYLEKTKEEKYLFAIFDCDNAYFNRLISYLNSLLLEISRRLENFDNDNVKSKVLLPR